MRDFCAAGNYIKEIFPPHKTHGLCLMISRLFLQPLLTIGVLSFLAGGSLRADPPQQVLVEICEKGIPEKPEWPKTVPAAIP